MIATAARQTAEGVRSQSVVHVNKILIFILQVIIQTRNKFLM